MDRPPKDDRALRRRLASSASTALAGLAVAAWLAAHAWAHGRSDAVEGELAAVLVGGGALIGLLSPSRREPPSAAPRSFPARLVVALLPSALAGAFAALLALLIGFPVELLAHRAPDDGLGAVALRAAVHVAGAFAVFLALGTEAFLCAPRRRELGRGRARDSARL